MSVHGTYKNHQTIITMIINPANPHSAPPRIGAKFELELSPLLLLPVSLGLFVTTTVSAGRVLVTVRIVGTTEPFGRVVDVSEVIVVGGGVITVVSVHEVVNTVSVGLVAVTGTVTVMGTCAVVTPPRSQQMSS